MREPSITKLPALSRKPVPSSSRTSTFVASRATSGVQTSTGSARSSTSSPLWVALKPRMVCTYCGSMTVGPKITMPSKSAVTVPVRRLR